MVPAILILALAATPTFRQGKVYEVGHPNTFLYQYKESITKTGDRLQIETHFSTKSGQEAVVEKFEEKGGQLVSYQVLRILEGLENTITVSNGNATYTEKNLKTGDIQTDQDDWDNTTLVVPQVQAFALKHWDALMSGDTVEFRIAIPEKLQSYGFKVFKDHEYQKNGMEVVVLKMKPSSFFIALVLDSFKVSIDKKNRKFLSLSGPSSLPRVSPGPNEMRDIEADLMYL